MNFPTERVFPYDEVRAFSKRRFISDEWKSTVDLFVLNIV
jgi:hypothetical protein